MEKISTLDPNALSATKLRPGGMTAQEVAYKRKGIELGLAEQKLAADVKNKATEQKAAEANMKAFPPITETVSLPYTQEWSKRMAAEQRQLANDLALFKQGKGSDPNNPLSEAGMARLARNIGHKQYASNTNAYYKLTNDLITDIRTNPGSYVDGALEEALAAQRDVKVAETGQYPDLSRRLFDLDKYVADKLGAIKAGGSGRAITLGDGSIKTTSSEYILENDVKAGIQEALTKPEARDEALRRFEALPLEDKNAVLEFSKNNNMSPDAGMLYNLLKPVYSYNKYKETLQQPSESGAGAQADKRGSLWLGKLIEGYMDKSYQLDRGQGGTKLVSPAKDAAGLFGKTEDVFRDPTTLVGWKWDTKNVFDGTQQVKVEKDIKDFQVDYDNQVFTVKIGKAGDKEVTETEIIPFDQAESKLVPRLGGLNKENIRAIGGYDAAAEVTGEGTRKGAGAGNIVKTPAKRGAWDLNDAGELE